MIENMIMELKKYLPLMITGLDWSRDIFTFYGPEWSFSTVSVWRVIKGNKVEYACYDDNVRDKLNKFVDEKILNVSFQSTQLKIDPVFFLSDGSVLEIFATDTYEPWVFSIPSGICYVASPSDPKYSSDSESSRNGS